MLVCQAVQNEPVFGLISLFLQGKNREFRPLDPIRPPKRRTCSTQAPGSKISGTTGLWPFTSKSGLFQRNGLSLWDRLGSPVGVL